MAAIALIGGSILGWVTAGLAILAGALASTAFVLFLMTSLTSALLALFFVSRRNAP